MIPQTSAKPAEVAVIPKPVEHSRIAYAVFVKPIRFGGVSEEVQVGRSVDSITPARVEVDGSAVVTDKGQRADGLLLRRTLHNRVSGQRERVQSFVPWSNVCELGYSE